ncbi:MAG: thioester domain-containing protein, partial [Acutalibacteraceae bacterium]
MGKKLLGTVLAFVLLMTTLISVVGVTGVSGEIIPDVDLLSEGQPYVIEDGSHQTYWGFGVTYDGDRTPYLHLSVSSEVPFQIALLDNSSVGISDKWILMSGDFYPAFGLTEAPADNLIPAGSYNVSLYLKGCYTYNNTYPEDHTLHIDALALEPSGPGRFEVSALSLSADAVYAIKSDEDFLQKEYIAEGAENITIDENGDWIITGNIALAPNFAYNYSVLPYLKLSAQSDVPYQIVLLDRSADGSYNDHYINLYANYVGTDWFPAGVYHQADSIKAIYDYNIAYGDWTNQDDNAAVTSIYINLDGQGTLTLRSLRLNTTNEVDDDGYHYYTRVGDLYYQRSPHTISDPDARSDLRYGYTPSVYKLYHTEKETPIIVFCSDFNTSAKEGVYFRRMKLEDSPIYENEAVANKLRAIMDFVYPYESIQSLIDRVQPVLSEDMSGLTQQEAISAIQMAIWHYANTVDLTYVRTYAFGNHLGYPAYTGYDINAAGQSVAVSPYLKNGVSVTSANDGVNSQSEQRILGLYNYLTWLEPKTDSVREMDISISVRYEGSTAYLTYSADQTNEDGTPVELSLTVTGATVDEIIDHGDGSYEAKVTGFRSTMFSAYVSGSQDLGNRPYFYQAEGGVDAAQSFIGLDTAPYTATEAALFAAPVDPVGPPVTTGASESIIISTTTTEPTTTTTEPTTTTTTSTTTTSTTTSTTTTTTTTSTTTSTTTTTTTTTSTTTTASTTTSTTTTASTTTSTTTTASTTTSTTTTASTTTSTTTTASTTTST